jgi:diguanylate cyclase (GGDEF)-like protein
MESGRIPRHWRETIGLILAACSAVLLLLAALQIARLNAEAGGDISMLARERVAIEYSRDLRTLFVDVEGFRRYLALHGDPHMDPAVRSKIDGEMRHLRALTVGPAQSLDVLISWQAVDHAWATARRGRRPSSGRATSVVVRRIEDLYAALEDKSGLMYDPYRNSQNLADIIFAKIPGAINEAAHSDLIAENAVRSGTITIAERNELAVLLHLTSSDYDLSTDGLSEVLADARSHDPSLRSAIDRTRADSAAYSRDGTAFRVLAGAAVRDRIHPAGDVAAIRRSAQQALAAASRVNDDLLGIFDRSLVRRSYIEKLRDRYLYAALLFAATFLVGTLLFVAEVLVRRERDALRQVQREAARLSAELALQKADRALRLSEAQFRAVFEGAALGIAILDRAGTILDANAVFRGVFADDATSVLAGQEENFAELMRGERDLFEFEQHVLSGAGNEAWTDSTVSLVTDEAGEPLFAICTFRDVTQLRSNERRMLHDMMHDALTGLPNRLLFESELREQFERVKLAPDGLYAVLFIDLDRFKDINESLGREAGDFVLGQVAQRMRAAVEPLDVVGRLGSDEFAVLIRSISDVVHVELVARRMLAAMAKPIVLRDRSIFISPSIGIAVGSSAYDRAEDAMRDADIAMRYAKSGGGSGFALFDSKMYARSQKRLELTTDMRLAIDRNEFFMLYQPIVSLVDGSLCGCEALLRWNHPLDGLVLPNDFMPLAEKTGLAKPIGRFVVLAACTQLAAWKRSGAFSRRAFAMNVNISATELEDADFETMLLKTVRQSGVVPEDLTLEITESVVLETGTRTNAIVNRLRAHGFKVCIDDFGTGYSSLRYLQQFKVDTLKIDRSFVAGADGEVASEPIVRTLMTLAESFDVRVVAEGIETQVQRDVLRNAGCRYAQGFYFSHAVSPQELSAMYPEAFGKAPRPASA